MKIFLLDEIGKAFIPRKIRPHLRIYLLKAGITEVPYKLFGAMFYISILITGLIYMMVIYPAIISKSASLVVLGLTTFFYVAVVLLGQALLFMIGYYVYLDQKIMNRTKTMERLLQEFLRYVSENLKGGMSFENAMWDAIRPKFGVLAHEIRLAAKRVMTGQDIDQALTEFTSKYDSPMLKRTFSLIQEGMRGGHQVAELIDRIEVNLRETRELKQEIVATNSTYVIFLSMIALVITPGLFALSYNLLMILYNISQNITSVGAVASNLPISIDSLSVDPRQYRIFSSYAISLTGFFAALIVSIINKGNIKQGLKYIPVYVGLSLIVYLGLRTLLLTMFSGMFQV